MRRDTLYLNLRLFILLCCMGLVCGSCSVVDTALGKKAPVLNPHFVVKRHAIAPLGDTEVIIIPGSNDASWESWAEVYLYDLDKKTLYKDPALDPAFDRTDHEVVAYKPGCVMVMGGIALRDEQWYSSEDPLSNYAKQTETYCIGDAQFKPGPPLNVGRADFTVTPLNDGNMLVYGGGNGVIGPAPPELYIAKENRFILLEALSDDRFDHRAVKLKNGDVLFIGGLIPVTSTVPKNQVIRYDASERVFKKAGYTHFHYLRHTATLLPTGKVLIIGRQYPGGEPIDISDALQGKRVGAELFDPETGESEIINGPLEKRASHTAELLPDGRVWIIGGSQKITRGFFNEKVDHPTTEFYLPEKNQFVYGPKMDYYRVEHRSILMGNRAILVGGGWYQANPSLVSELEY